MERIVVGVDGSQASQEALKWAMGLAREVGATVEAVHAWEDPYVGGYPYTSATYDPGEFERSAKRLLDTVVDGVGDRGLLKPVERRLVNGPAAIALLEAARGADLIVVGTRGAGGFKGLLLGSVSQQAVHYAPCPVVVIPPAK